MASRFEVCLAGQGGQGLILAGLILAEAAVLDGKNATMTQSYGAEQRGGASHSEVIISDGDIDYPRVLKTDLLVALSQEAFDNFHHEVKKEGIILTDSHLVEKKSGDGLIALPIVETAKGAAGSGAASNMVALGLIAGLTKIVSCKALHKAIDARSPRGTQRSNRWAFKAGFDLAKTISPKAKRKA
ncbi:MAG: 2-oxoacid:acceptor oxidoreductase family protein [Chloroflexi bacterium]|nr:2-oxoacid:acceptor oxidoreductase family protein [Chloroflexota bacterium]